MFTGIIEEVGKISSFEKKGRSATLRIQCEKVRDGLRPGDSVAVDGICLTVVKIAVKGIAFDLSTETLKTSTADRYARGAPVNLERAARLGDRMGGHLVSGHIDGIGRITRKIKAGSGINLEIRIPRELTRYTVIRGSIAVDGISLTIAGCRADRISLALIPHTLQATTLQGKGVGSRVNIECDVIGKYVEKWISPGA